jgi:prepilin-type N-terminal cleavage/methylation domain-containing protein
VGTERNLSADRSGFTLVEVLVAMVILAVGLLGLEALGIGVARSLSLAQRQSQYATLASDSLESALHQLRRGTLPRAFCVDDLPRGDRMSRVVTQSQANLVEVTVMVIPNASAPNPTRSTFEVGSSLYLPDPTTITGTIDGTPCS